MSLYFLLPLSLLSQRLPLSCLLRSSTENLPFRLIGRFRSCDFLIVVLQEVVGLEVGSVVNVHLPERLFIKLVDRHDVNAVV